MISQGHHTILLSGLVVSPEFARAIIRPHITRLGPSVVRLVYISIYTARQRCKPDPDPLRLISFPSYFAHPKIFQLIYPRKMTENRNFGRKTAFHLFIGTRVVRQNLFLNTHNKQASVKMLIYIDCVSVLASTLIDVEPVSCAHFNFVQNFNCVKFLKLEICLSCGHF